MKNVPVLLFIICMGSIVHAMDKIQLELCKGINCDQIKDTLRNDYYAYLVNRLKEYRKSDLTVDDIEKMQQKRTLFAGDNSQFNLNTANVIMDEDGNTFAHVAIQKCDKEILARLSNYPCDLPINANKAGEDALDLCIKHLVPTAAEDKKAAAREMLGIVLARYHRMNQAEPRKKQYIQKLIMLEFAHKKAGNNFVVEDAWIKGFFKQAAGKKLDTVLAEIYPQVMDEEKNTFTHLALMNNASDDLYALLQKHFVAFTKNAQEKTPLDIAIEQFRRFTQNSQLIDAEEEVFNRARCCLFMLMNYIAVQQEKPLFGKCCDKHKIEQEK